MNKTIYISANFKQMHHNDALDVFNTAYKKLSSEGWKVISAFNDYESKDLKEKLLAFIDSDAVYLTSKYDPFDLFLAKKLKIEVIRGGFIENKDLSELKFKIETFFGIRLGSNQTRKVIDPTFIFYMEARMINGLTYKCIGDYIGKKHSTVMCGERKALVYLKSDKNFKEKYESYRNSWHAL